MYIRHSEPQDLERIMEIYSYARNFMAEHGNPLQWGPTNWPPEELIREDIAAGRSYVCVAGDKLAGTFCFLQGEDIEPTYRRIEDGGWLQEGPYGVIHRLAGDGSVKGVGAFCIDWAYGQCGHLRVDTHGDNVVMQRLLEKLGFLHCGTIHVQEDPYPRLAYEKSEALLRQSEDEELLRRSEGTLVRQSKEEALLQKSVNEELLRQEEGKSTPGENHG